MIVSESGGLPLSKRRRAIPCSLPACHHLPPLLPASPAAGAGAGGEPAAALHGHCAVGAHGDRAQPAVRQQRHAEVSLLACSSWQPAGLASCLCLR